MESDTDLDLLFVTFDSSRITIADLVEAVQQQGFDVEVKDDG